MHIPLTIGIKQGGLHLTTNELPAIFVHNSGIFVPLFGPVELKIGLTGLCTVRVEIVGDDPVAFLRGRDRKGSDPRKYVQQPVRGVEQGDEAGMLCAEARVPVDRAKVKSEM